MLDKTFIKIICICSFITGAILGIIPLIPVLFWTAFLIEMFLVAPFMIIYMNKLKLIENIDMGKCLSIGAISGGVSFLGFSLVFFPLAFIINLIFKTDSFLWIKVLFNNFGFVIPMIIFTALLSSLLNMFSGFLTMYFYAYFGKTK